MNSENHSPRRQSIFRTSKTKGTTSGYTRIDNDLLQDKKLSDRARGLLVRMLSRPDDWIFYVEQLSQDTSDSLHKIRGALRELRERGYLMKIQLLRETTKRRNGSTHIVFENPDMPEKQQVGKTARRKSPPTNTDDTKNEEKEDPLTPSGDTNPIANEEAAPDEEPPNPRECDEIQTEAPTDSPSATGTPSSDSFKRGTRHLTWNIGVDPIPEEQMLRAFATNRWCMALAAMFQMQAITQPEARRIVGQIIGGKLGPLQMLWAQVVYLPRHPEPYTGSWDDLMARLVDTKRPLCDAHPDAEIDDVKSEVNSWLNHNSGPENLQAILDAVIQARITPMTEDDADAMHVFASTWRAYLKLNANGSSASSAFWNEQIEFMVIRPSYNLQGPSANVSDLLVMSEALWPGDVDALEEVIREAYEDQDSAPN